MKLEEYLAKKRLYGGRVVADFADRVGVHPSMIYKYLSGASKPRPDTAKKIVKETRGAVTLDEQYA